MGIYAENDNEPDGEEENDWSKNKTLD
jgi:hypothetical protein